MKGKTMTHRKARRMQNKRMASCLHHYNSIDLSLLSVPADLLRFITPAGKVIIGACNIQTTRGGFINAFFHEELLEMTA